MRITVYTERGIFYGETAPQTEEEKKIGIDNITKAMRGELKMLTIPISGSNHKYGSICIPEALLKTAVIELSDD